MLCQLEDRADVDEHKTDFKGFVGRKDCKEPSELEVKLLEKSTLR